MFNKFLKIFIIIIVIPIIVVNVGLNSVYKSILLKEYSKKNQELVKQTSLDIYDELKTSNLSAATVANDSDFMYLLNSWNNSNDNYDKFNISKEIDDKLNYIFSYNSSIKSIIFFFEDKGYYSFKKPLYRDEDDVREENWYKEAYKSPNKVQNLNLYKINSDSDEKGYISVAISPSTAKYSNVEMIYFEYATNMFDGIYSKYNNEYGNFIIVDDMGDVIINGKNNLEFNQEQLKNIINKKEEEFTQIINSDKYNISKSNIKNSNWYLINITNYNKLTSDVNDVFKAFISIYILIILLFIIFLLMFFNGIVKPIDSLVFKMKNIESLDFNNEIEIDGTMEILELKKSYNKMIKRINILVKEKDIKEKERREEEIKALQSQINPHFLYNTLNSVRLMAMMSNVKSIENMIEAFMKLLSATYKSTSPYVSLEEEIENTKNYIKIMKVRFGDDISVRWDIDDNTKELFVFKLMLQPIVENSMLHGLSNLDRKGEILIKTYIEDDFLIIEVLDNGEGLNEEDIIGLLNGSKKNKRAFNNIGISNINKRIILNYGDKYGLKIKSKKQEYTCVSYYLPIIKSVGEEY